jgi:AcrR family transcriptional regulator
MEKGHILKGCAHLFGKWGVHSVTMDDIARHLGVSKKTLYKIYDNKDAIVTDFVRSVADESRLELKTQMTPGQTFTTQFSIFNWFIVTQALALGTTLLYDIRKYHPSAYQLIKQYKHEMIVFLNDLLVEGQRTGMVRSNIDPMVSAELRINVLEWDMMEANHNRASIRSKQNQFFDLILNGLQANKNLNTAEKNA